MRRPVGDSSTSAPAQTGDDLAGVGRTRYTGTDVSGSRTIAPDRRRLREASRAGLRPRSRWLGRGLLCLALAAGLEVYGPNILQTLQELLRSDDPQQLLTIAALTLASALLALLGLAALIGLGAAGLSRDLGPVDHARRRRLRIGAGDRPSPKLWWIGLILLGVTLAVHRGVLAGASRAVDSSPTTLAGLWYAWGLEVLTIGGALLVVGGAVELYLDERARRRTLYRSPEELREELREQTHGQPHSPR